MKKYILVSLAFVFFGSTLFAQNRDTKKADKSFDHLEYVKAIKEYKKLVDKGDATPYVYKRLGDAYFNLRDSNNAALYYSKYFDEAKDPIEPKYYFRYAQLVKAQGKEDESNTYMRKFAHNAPNDGRAQAFKANPNYLSELQNAEPDFKLSKLNLNTNLQDFGAFKHDGKFYFVSARNSSRKTFGWTGQPTLDVYVATKKAGKFTEPEQIEGDVNTKYNEGNVVITNDGKTLYFTRNDYTNKKYRKSSNGINKTKIYSAKKIDKGWGDINEVPFDNSEYSTRQPVLSPDGKTMYFSSDMPGGIGQFDIYKVAINDDGSFGDPVNLGSPVNTPGDEGFPFVASDGTLYFASNGHLGLGGLDVFKAEPRGNGFGNVQNMGKEVNSAGDDYAFAYYPDKKYGFVSSNRSGISDGFNIADDNIYRVIPIQQVRIYAKVLDAETGRAIPNAKIGVYTKEPRTKAGLESANPQGVAIFRLPGGKKHYSVEVTANGYNPNAMDVKYAPEGKINMVVELEPIKKMITKTAVNLKPIFFKFDKANITKEGAFELDKLVDIMKKHPDMKIHVIAHTDYRGTDAYNMALSKRRAKNTVDYVVSHGIDASRIDGEGVGESQPKVKCAPKCSDAQNAKNRRSNFMISNKDELKWLK